MEQDNRYSEIAPMCLISQLGHRYELADSSNGKSDWICKACGDFKTEYEDSCP